MDTSPQLVLWRKSFADNLKTSHLCYSKKHRKLLPGFCEVFLLSRIKPFAVLSHRHTNELTEYHRDLTKFGSVQEMMQSVIAER